MKFLFSLKIIFISSLLFNFTIFAQEKQVLNWEESIQETARNNPDLAAAEQSVRKAEADYRRSYADFFPFLSFDSSYTAANSAILGPFSVESPSNQGLQQQISVGPVMRENIFSGFKNLGALQKSKADLQAAKASLEIVKSQVSFDLKTAFSKLLYIQKLLQLNEEILNRRKQNVKLVELRFDVGREHKGSFLRSDAFLSQAELDIFQAQQNLKSGMTELGKVLGKRRPEEAFLVVQGEFKAQPPKSDPDFESLILQTPTRKQAKAESESDKSSLRVARSQFFPTLDAVASYARIRNNFETNIERWSAGATFSYPFLNTGRSFFEVRSAQADYRQSLEVLRSKTNQVSLDLKRSYSDFLNALQTVEVQKKFLKAAQVRSEVARSQYANGLISFQDWDIIENDLINTQKSMLASLNNIVLAEAAWERAQGKGVFQ